MADRSVQSSNIDYASSLYAVTLEQYKDTLQDNIFKSNLILDEIKKSSKIPAYDGGKSVVVPVLLEATIGGGSYSGYDLVDVTPSKGMANVEMPWSYYWTPVVISDQEIDENAGKAKIVDILSAKIMQSEESLTGMLSDHLWHATAQNSGKDLTPFPVMIAAAATSSYMGIDGATYSTWNNRFSSGPTSTLDAMFGTVYRQVRDGADMPEFIVTSDNGERNYESFIATDADVAIRYTTNDKGDIGYARLQYKGLPILTDKHVPDATLNTYYNYWFMSPKYLGFKMKDLNQTDWILSPIQPGAKTKFIRTTVQLFCSQRRRQGLVQTTAAVQ